MNFSALKQRYSQTCNRAFPGGCACKMGYTSCTSSRYKWVVPKEQPLKPAMLQNMLFDRELFERDLSMKMLTNIRLIYMYM